MSSISAPAGVDFRPTLRPEIRFSPPNLHGTQEIHYVKDQATGWFYRIGTKEHFLLSRMDGRHTLAELGLRYAETFGRRLDERAWGRIFALIDQRQLLVETATPERLAALRDSAEENLRHSRRGLLRYRLRLIDPDRLLGAVAPRLGFAFQPAFVALVLAAFVAVQLLVLAHLPALIATVQASWRDPAVLAGFGLLVLFSIVLHEFAHGLACKYYGGSVREMGILWRYLSFFPYCKLDDALLFANPRHRVATAGAGCIANVVALLPFGVLWLLAPEGSTLQLLSAWMLTVYNLIALFDLIPFVELDGYFMLSYALGMADLRKDSHRFWALRLRKTLLGKGEGVAGYSARARRIYSLYGLFSLLFTGLIFVLSALFWFRLFSGWFGEPLAWLIALASLATMLLAPLVGQTLRRRAAVGMPSVG